VLSNNSLITPIEFKESLRGALAPLLKNLPLPLVKGKGIKGIGLINNP
jgi:hypothetical protein